MHDSSEGLPMRQYILAPSCVPSVQGLENAGAEFDEKRYRRNVRFRKSYWYWGSDGLHRSN